MKAQLQKNVSRRRRSLSVRASIRKTATRPRLSIHRSLKHISAQIIDDKTGRTLVALSSTSKAMASELSGKNKTDRARLIGTEIGKRAKEAGIGKVVFDRGPCRYHGRVKALAEGARESGLEF